MKTFITKAKFKKIAIRAAVVLFWLILWQGISMIVQQEIVFVSPVQVFQRLFTLVGTGDFWHVTSLSLGRIFFGFLMGTFIGVALAILTTRFSIFHELFSPVLSVMRATPVTSFIILAFFLLAKADIPGFVSILMVTPIVWKNVAEGISQTDGQLLEMAKVMHVKPFTVVGKIYIPSVKPYFNAACLTAIGLAWKAGVAAEVITNPTSGIGAKMYQAKVDLEMADLFAWTIVVIVLSVFCETCFSYFIKRRGRVADIGQRDKGI